MMSTSSHSKAENGVIQSSSIGLLQERFRQLQKMKEMRENKDLLRMFSDYNNNNNTTTSSTNVSPIIGVVCNTSSYTTTSTITRTTNTISSGTPLNNNNNNSNNNNKNNKNQISDYCSMQYNDQPLQIFIPPNYSSLNNPKSSCYSSSAAAAAATTTTTTTASTSTPPSSSSSSSSQNSSNMRIIDPTTDISLSLWPYNNNSTPAATAYPFRQQNSDNLLLSTMNMQRQPVAGVPVSRPSTSYKSEDPPHHLSDVDTTLHL